MPLYPSQTRISAIEKKLKVRAIMQMSECTKTYKVFSLQRDYFSHEHKSSVKIHKASYVANVMREGLRLHFEAVTIRRNPQSQKKPFLFSHVLLTNIFFKTCFNEIIDKFFKKR